jgi:hypothetical protein
MTEVAAPFVAALSQADGPTVANVKRDVIAAMNERHPDCAVDACGTLVVGVK